MDWCSHTWSTPPLGMLLPRGCRSESRTPSWGLTTAPASCQGLQSPQGIAACRGPSSTHHTCACPQACHVGTCKNSKWFPWQPPQQAEASVDSLRKPEGGGRKPALSAGVQCGPGRTHPGCPSSQGFLGTTRSDAQREEMHKGAAPLPRLSPQSVPTRLPRPCPVGHWGSSIGHPPTPSRPSHWRLPAGNLSCCRRPKITRAYHMLSSPQASPALFRSLPRAPKPTFQPGPPLGSCQPSSRLSLDPACE